MHLCAGQLSEPLLHAMLDALHMGIIVLSPGGDVVFCNAVASQLLALPMEGNIGKGWAELFDMGGPNAFFHQALLDVMHGELPHLERHVVFQRPDGTFVELALHAAYVKDDARLAGILLALQETDADHSCGVHTKELLDRMAKLSHEREEALLHLASAVAHQVRNPVTVIGGQTSLLRREAVTTRQQERLDIIHDEAVRLEGLVRELSAFVSIAVRTPEWVRIGDYFRRMLAAHCALHLHIECDIPQGDAMDEDARVWADPTLLDLVIAELVSNSATFARPGVPVAIKASLHRSPRSLVVVYEDNSRGIDSNMLPYVFDPFYSTSPSGVGMGLCKVRRCMMVMGGNATMEPGNGNGVRILLQFPLQAEITP